MKKTQFYKIIFLIVSWTFATIFIISYEGAALGFKPPADLIKTGMEYNFRATLLTGALFTFVIGAIMASFEVLYFSKVLRKKPLGVALFIKTVFYISNIFVWTSLAIIVMYSNYLGKSIFHEQVLTLYLKYLTSARLLMTLCFWCIIIIITLFIIQVSDKFGQGVLINNIISWNSTGPQGYGGGVFWYREGGLFPSFFPDIINCVICGNTSSEGGGICCWGSPVCCHGIIDTILWNNEATLGPEICHDEGWGLKISFSDIKGGQASVIGFPEWGPGIIDADPMFVDPVNGDFHLTFPSPCKDAGDNSALDELYDFEGDPRIAYGTVDMGADEFSNHLYCIGEFTPNGSIKGKFVGLPSTWPVGLFIGSGIMDPPIQHMWGEFYLESPWLLFPLVPIPSNGVLEIPSALPGIPAPYDIPMQALIEWKLSNLFVLEVR